MWKNGRFNYILNGNSIFFVFVKIKANNSKKEKKFEIHFCISAHELCAFEMKTKRNEKKKCSKRQLSKIMRTVKRNVLILSNRPFCSILIHRFCDGMFTLLCFVTSLKAEICLTLVWKNRSF